MKSIRSLVFILTLLPLLTFGQEFDTIVNINKIEVLGMRVQNDNIIGIRKTSINTDVLSSNITGSLSEVLSDNTLIYIKSLGHGGLATSSFRGTSSNHTQVNWNGININSPMLGNFDFSQVPAFFTDEVTLFHGSSYLKNGTGALGGSINLNNHSAGGNGKRIQILSEYGSNRTFTEGVSFSFASKNVISRTRLYFQSSKNNFEYLNKVLKMDAFKERRENASYVQAGIMQEVYYKIKDNLMLNTVLWFMYNDRNLPQQIVINNKTEERERSNSLRAITTLIARNSRSEFKTSFSYLRDYMKYNLHYPNGFGDRGQRNISNSFIVKEDYAFKASKTVKLVSMLGYRHDRVDSNNYLSQITSRNTLTLQGGAEWKPSVKFTLSGNVMGEVNDEIVMPTFSAGAKYIIKDNLLDVSASVSYNYHYPTLNDLYWRPGGNSQLKPEKGFSYDATVSYRPNVGEFSLRFDATYYIMNISNWIVWLPTYSYFWSPENVKNVRSQGVELFSEVGFRKHKLSLNYGYSHSVDRFRGSTYGKQLPYIPLNKFNARYSLSVTKFMFSCSAAFTDKRYTSTDEKYSTNAYTIFDAEFGYNVREWLLLKLSANNIFDTYYESTEYYPMPLRTMNISAILRF